LSRARARTPRQLAAEREIRPVVEPVGPGGSERQGAQRLIADRQGDDHQGAAVESADLLQGLLTAVPVSLDILDQQCLARLEDSSEWHQPLLLRAERLGPVQ
jgi:hypothetical protein